MKLIQKTNRSYLLILLIVFPIACVFFFFILKYFVEDETNEKLRADEFRIIERLKVDTSIVSIAPIIDVELSLKDVTEPIIQNIYLYDPVEKEEELFRELSSVVDVNGIHYSIKVRHSTIESKDFLSVIGLSFAFILILILSLLYVINRRVFNKLWGPFYKNLQLLRSFSITTNENLILEESEVTEFKELNHCLVKLTNKLGNDYRLLKEFTENASHELQTPLTIILLNLDETLQKPLDQETYKKIYSCFVTAKRLSLLNEKLLLLTKLDNDQYGDVLEINMNESFQKQLEELAPLIEEKRIQLKVDNFGEFRTKMDPILTNILINNILSNAIRHNHQEGIIHISISSSNFTIVNSSKEKLPDQQLFDRFIKGRNSPDSVGLGLSIIKKICTIYNLKVLGTQNNENVTFSITASEKHQN